VDVMVGEEIRRRAVLEDEDCLQRRLGILPAGYAQ